MSKPNLKSTASAVSVEVVHAANIDASVPFGAIESLGALLTGPLASLALGRSFEKLRATISAVEALREGGPSFDETPEQEADLVEFVEGAGAHLSRMLQVYAKLLQPGSFSSRVVRFSRDLDEPEEPWSDSGVYNAAPALLEGSLDVLDKLMDEVRSRTEEPSLTVWLHSVSFSDMALFMAYVRRDDGPDALFLIKGSSWARVNASEEKRRALVRTLLEPEHSDKRAWEGFLREQARFLRENHREAVQSALTGLGMEKPLTDEQWSELCQTLFCNQFSPRLYQEAARDMGRDTLQEAHALLHTMTESLVARLEQFDVQQKEAEKDFERKGRKMRSDLERSTMMRAGLQKRADRVDLENQDLRRQLKAQAAQTSRTSADPLALAKALDALF